jgi:hypothetical protein
MPVSLFLGEDLVGQHTFDVRWSSLGRDDNMPTSESTEPNRHFVSKPEAERDRLIRRQIRGL